VKRDHPAAPSGAPLFTRCLAVLAGALLIAGTGCAQARSPVTAGHRPVARPSPRQPLRVMPLGDSITDGLLTLGGYRSDLWQYLTADGMSVDFVGSRSSGPPQLGDHDDEGHPGWRIDQVTSHARAWLLRYRPDVVLLHIGTNDVIQRRAMRRAPARLAALIDLITTTLPDVRVYVATIIPLRDPRFEAGVRRYNAAIPRVVAERAAMGHRVKLVNMHRAITRADLSPDGIHPTGGGYSKMAARWYAALTGVPMTRWEAERAAYTTINDGERLTSATGSGGGKVGYLTAAGSYLEYAVRAPRTGRYRVYVRAATGMSTPCEQRLSVNGRPAGRLRYWNYGWERWTITAADVSLTAGRNTVRLTRSTCGAEIDSIDLAPR
jgi:lysophospholipase L1-like esterase